VPAADLPSILAEAERTIAAATTPQELIEVRARFLGKKGSLSGVLRGLGGLAAAERAALGAAANEAKASIEAWADAKRAALAAAGEAASLASGRLDVSLPGAAAPRGRMHPVSVIERDVAEFFTRLGHSIEDGPEVETDWNNFGALNFPEDHPARDLQDTFFVEGGHVMRTHTSPVQIRTMTGRTPPFRFVVPGRVYRNDLDATHSPMFHQIEGFCVGENVSFADLKGTLYAFARHLFGEDTKLRFRAHFFPFTEPSAEMDVTWRGGWLEWGGCGMIHPRVLLNCGLDPDRWQGFAFGMALDRPALLRFGVPNLQLLFDGDLRVLEQL